MSSWRETSRRLADELDESFAAALRWPEVEDELWRARPGPGAWSAAEVCEHVTLMHRYLLILVDKIRDRARKRLVAGERPPPEPSRLDQLEGLARREAVWDSPAHMVPTGDVSRAELRRRLEGDRERCLAYLIEMPDGEGALHTIRFSVVDARLDLYQFLKVIELHLRRHLAQMERHSQV